MKKKSAFIILSCFIATMSQAQFKQVYSFLGAWDGEFPYGNVTLSGHTLFGMTFEGGTNNRGLVFANDTAGMNERILWNFDDTGSLGNYNGANPYGSLILLGKKLFGMNDVTIFSIDTDGTRYRDVYDFQDTAIPCQPHGNLLFAFGKFFGMGSSCASDFYGGVFSVDTNGRNAKTILSFNGTNGSTPYGSLINSGKKLFGMTSIGGTFDSGVIFTVDTGGRNFKILKNLRADSGCLPQSSLVLSGKKLYGMTLVGGPGFQRGVAFSIDTNGRNYKILHSFQSTEGFNPYGDLTLAGGKVYGMTNTGGAYGAGTIISIDTNGSNLTDLFDFAGYTSGYFPYGSLSRDNYSFFGMCHSSGVYNYGNIFKLTDNSITTSVSNLVPSSIGVAVYPNPCIGVFNLTLNNKASVINQVKIYNELGQEVFVSTPLNNRIQLDLSNQPNGVYFYRVENETSVGEGKIVIAR